MEAAADLAKAYGDEVVTALAGKPAAFIGFALKRISQLRALVAHLERECLDVNEMYGVQIERAERYIDLLKPGLEQATRDAIKERRKHGFDGKTVRMPHGESYLRKGYSRWHVYDEPAALQWCKDNAPELVRQKVTYSLDKKAMAKRLAAHKDSPPPGMEYIDGQDGWDFKVTKWEDTPCNAQQFEPAYQFSLPASSGPGSGPDGSI